MKMRRIDGLGIPGKRRAKCVGAEKVHEQDCEDRMLPSRSGMPEMKTCPGGAASDSFRA